jgi:hypothetical protein
MANTTVTTPEPAWAAFLALDWGSQKHAWILQPADGGNEMKATSTTRPRQSRSGPPVCTSALAADPWPSPWNRSEDRL